MRILVLGAGVVGTTSAWYLAQAGHEVTVVDRQPAAGNETSFANGGQISVSHAEPWANPHILPRLLKWLGREDAPLLWRWRADPAQLSWGLRFLFECLPGATRHNMAAIVALSLYSRRQLRKLRQSLDLQYDQLQRGILHVYTEPKEFEAAIEAARIMREFGLDRDTVDVDKCLEIEPALADARHLLVGGDYTASDESGDAHKFTRALAERAQAAGVDFRLNLTVDRIAPGGRKIAGVLVRGPHGSELLTADAYVVALGSYSPQLVKPLGICLPVYPAKGYSATLTLAENSLAPTVSLTDDERKLVFTRLGNRLRIAGTAEFNGYNLDLNPVRCQAVLQRVRQLFPRLEVESEPEFWCGLRPATPSNVPFIGRTRYGNLWLNTGHGTLGWTMACGSGAALADLISGRLPEPDFPFRRC
ncbi:D-amino acid dehydrogenase [Dechloromonas hortensis]|uniref:D-amino acid dehydrogenase n=1 Tax=Dechloromonas hortensis TaxID=337779 RepID=UPI0012908F1F|nr:D-amino acid dehydrogenase [Dechloromonas hortensis]